MTSPREYPERPVVGVGGVIIDRGRALLIRRGSEPLLGEWSIPGGTLELGESLGHGVARELLEETGIEVRVLDMIEVFDRIFMDDGATGVEGKHRPRFHFVIVDYLCERLAGELRSLVGVEDLRPSPRQRLVQRLQAEPPVQGVGQPPREHATAPRSPGGPHPERRAGRTGPRRR